MTELQAKRSEWLERMGAKATDILIDGEGEEFIMMSGMQVHLPPDIQHI